MMVLPLLIIVLLPKVVNTNDPEMRKVCSLCCLSELNGSCSGRFIKDSTFSERTDFVMFKILTLSLSPFEVLIVLKC